MKKSLKWILFLLLIIMVVTVIFFFARSTESNRTPGQNIDIIETDTPTEAKQAPRDGISTVLFLGTEQTEIVDAENYRNNKRADLVFLLVMDEQRNKITALQINPDLVVPFMIPGTDKPLETSIDLVYSYGSGGSDSCLNVRKTISSLLDGVPIDHYLTFETSALADITEMVGGVTVTATEEFTGERLAVNSGDEIVLNGEDAIDFFSFRKEEDVANAAHMNRQCQFMLGLYVPFKARMQNEDFLTKLTMKLGDRMSTDLTLSQMVQMLELLETYELDENIVTLQGNVERVDGEYQFFADESALKKTIESLFFQ